MEVFCKRERDYEVRTMVEASPGLCVIYALLVMQLQEK